MYKPFLNLGKLIVGTLVVVGIILGAVTAFPWSQMKWGTLNYGQVRTITVTGYSENQVANKVAHFTAGVSAVNDNRDIAIGEVNKKVTAITEAVKTFGINGDDIKTQNLSVYQGEETYYDNGQAKSRMGQWRVNNSIEITLRKIDKAGELADLLTKNGANNVYGPNFSLDNSKDNSSEQWEAAVKDAQSKAEKMAASLNVRLGKVVSVNEGAEGQSAYPILYQAKGEGMGGGGAAPVQPGTTTVSKTVTVVFALE